MLICELGVPVKLTCYEKERIVNGHSLIRNFSSTVLETKFWQLVKWASFKIDLTSVIFSRSERCFDSPLKISTDNDFRFTDNHRCPALISISCWAFLPPGLFTRLLLKIAAWFYSLILFLSQTFDTPWKILPHLNNVNRKTAKQKSVNIIVFEKLCFWNVFHYPH